MVLLVKLGLPIHGSLVMTGSLLRFLPGDALVAGLHDLICGIFTSGIASLAEVLLIGAIAGLMSRHQLQVIGNAGSSHLHRCAADAAGSIALHLSLATHL